MNAETLLIVDDNQILLNGIRDILSYEGYQVMTATNGKDALAQMQRQSPDMIVSDIRMPTMDGYAFLHKVRAEADWVSIPFIFLTAHGDRSEVINGKHVGVDDYLVKPLTSQELLTAVRARLTRSKQLRLAQLNHAYKTSLTALANAIDVRDISNHGHVERVTAYSVEIARELGWQEQVLESLRFGAILHDIGKIMIQESTLFKINRLDTREWGEIYQHPQVGAEMVKDIPHLIAAIPIIRYHHERWDGLGYPDGLAKEAIPIEARIVAVADGFDSMTIDKPYRLARSLQEAHDEIVRCAGSQYDPEIVVAFQRAWNANRIQTIHDNWDRGWVSDSLSHVTA